MYSYKLTLTEAQLREARKDNDNMGKNSHVGNVAVALVKLFFLAEHPDATFTVGTKGADPEVSRDGKIERFEIKGTAEQHIAWQKLKVSSQNCHDCLVQGMTLIRVTGVGSREVGFRFPTYGEDFTLVSEVRYAVKPLRKSKGTD